MTRAAEIILTFYAIFCYNYNYVVATQSSKQTSTNVHLDPPDILDDSWLIDERFITVPPKVYVKREDESMHHAVATQSPQQIATNIDTESMTDVECIYPPLPEYLELMDQIVVGEEDCMRKKRSPVTLEELIKQLSLMGNHDTSKTERKEGYFSFNYPPK